MPSNEFDTKADFFPDGGAGDIEVQAALDQHTTMLGGVARLGRIVERNSEDPKPPGDVPRVLVHIGGESKGSYIRNWMPWTTARAGCDGEWWAPEINEQVLVVAPSGNLTQGIVVGSLFRKGLTFTSIGESIEPADPLPGFDQGSAPSENEIHRRVYKDGSSISYDRNKHLLSVELKSATENDAGIKLSCVADEFIELTAGSTQISINKDGAIDITTADKEITITGNVTVKGTLNVID